MIIVTLQVKTGGKKKQPHIPQLCHKSWRLLILTSFFYLEKSRKNRDKDRIESSCLLYRINNKHFKGFLFPLLYSHRFHAVISSFILEEKITIMLEYLKVTGLDQWKPQGQ